MQQQIMLAQKIAAGGGSGQPPNTYANLQYWFSARDTATTFTSVNDTDPATSDGDFVNRVDSKSPTTRCMSGSSPVTENQTLELAEINSNNVVRFVFDVGDTPAMYTKPSSGANPTVATLSSAIKAAGAGTYVWAGVVDASVAAGGSPSAVTDIVRDDSGVWGFGFYESGGNIYFRHYNFDGNYDYIDSAAIAPGTPVVVSARHNSGQVRIRVNGGSFSNVASGNTSGLGNTISLMAGQNGDLFEWMDFCGYNVSLPDASLLEVERYFGALIGVTIP